MIYDRAKRLLNTSTTFGVNAESCGECSLSPPNEEQFILRMMIRTPDTNFKIPTELEWLRDTILACDKRQAANGIHNPFVYITVRHGYVQTTTDDLWHVDGFSTRVPHNPEQNYIWASDNPTEVLVQDIILPDDFNPLKHNIHMYFQDQAERSNIQTLDGNHLYVIDPYVIHRRPNLSKNVKRTFFRISFVPIEIEDDTCTVNPLIPRLKPYGREDIRNTLERYSA